MSANTVAGPAKFYLPRWLMALGSWFDDWVNPIVVKELRQAVRGWTAPSMFLLYLLVQMVTVGLMLMSSRGDNLSEEPVGSYVFLAVQVLLVIATVGLLPLYAGVRLFLERSEVNLDLMFATPLRPVWLVLGKLLAALVLGLLFFSASAPVMTMAYFLRGLDLVRAAVLLASDILTMIATVQVALFLAALPLPRAVSAVLGIGFLFGLLFWVPTLCALSWSYLEASRLPGRSPHEELFTLITIDLGAVFVTAFFFTATHALLSPPTSNRSFTFKLMLAFGPPLFPLASVFGIGWFVAPWLTSLPPPGWPETIEFLLLVLVPLTGIQSWLAWILAISERLTWGPRVLAQIPRWRWLQVIVFPFYSGAANGLVYASLLTLLRWCCIAALWWLLDTSAPSVYGFPSHVASTFARRCWIEWLADGYIIAYALTAFWLRRYWEQRFGKVLPGWLIFALAVGLVSFVSMILAITVTLLGLNSTDNLLMALTYIATPFVLVELTLGFWTGSSWGAREFENTFWLGELFAPFLLAIWLGVVLLPTALWWLRQVKRFRPPPPLTDTLRQTQTPTLNTAQQ